MKRLFVICAVTLLAACSGGGASDGGGTGGGSAGGGSATGGGGGGTGGGSADAGFALISTTPANQAVDVGVGTPIEVTFSSPAKQAVLTLSPTATFAEQTLDVSKTTSTSTLAAPLAANTTYTVTGTAIGENLSSLDFTFTFKTAAASTDTTRPTLSSSVPAANATNVLLNQRLTLTFSEKVDPDSVKVNTSPFVDLGPATFSTDGATATFATPAADFAANTAYLLNIEAADLAGNTVSGGVISFSFTTGTMSTDTTAPTVVANVPAASTTMVSPSLAPSVTFSEPMDPTATIASFSISPPVACNTTLDSSGTTLTCAHAALLQANTQYTVTISTMAKDPANNALATAHSFMFTTGATPDTTAPSLLSTVPADGGRARSCDQTVTFNFSEPMDKASLAGAISFSQGDGGKSVSFTGDGGSATAFVKSPVDWAPGSTVTVRIDGGARDTSGNGLSPTVVQTFRVRSEVTTNLTALIDDGYLGRQGSTVQNISTNSPNLWIGDYESSGSTDYEYRAFFSFDLSVLPAGAEIRSAVLHAFSISQTGTSADSFNPIILERVAFTPPLTASQFSLAVASTPTYCGICSCLRGIPLPGAITEPKLASSTSSNVWKSVGVTEEAQAALTLSQGRLQLRARRYSATAANNGVTDRVFFHSADSAATPSSCPGMPLRTNCKPYLSVTYYAP